MGQENSVESAPVTTEQLSQELALKFAKQSYTQLELHCFKEVFRSRADTESGIRYWSETTLCRFLELPVVLGAGPVLHQMAAFLASFPFWELAPCIMTVGNMLKVVTILTERYKTVLEAGDQDRYRMLYASLAVVDRRASETLRMEDFWTVEKTDEEVLEDTLQGISGLSIRSNGEHFSSPDEDKMAMAALRVLKAKSPDYITLSERPEIRSSIIPSDNFLKFIELLLLIAPLSAQDNLDQHFAQLSEDNLKAVRSTANAIIASFGVEDTPGITYNAFKAVIPNSLPFIFNGLKPLFEHFLFDKSFNLTRHKRSTSSSSQNEAPSSPTAATPAATPSSPLPEPGEILNLTTLSQLSFFIPSSSLFHRLHHLYSGTTHGFSLGSLEKCVFTWRAPTILLVHGTLLPATPTNSRERAFADALPPKRLPNSKLGATPVTRITYGAYVSTPWKHTHKSHFGDPSTFLFQLAPTHDVFRASSISKDYVSYMTPSPAIPAAGINFGSPLPSSAASKATGHGSASAASSTSLHVTLGPVSLYLDDGLEFGVFTHTAAGGGSFHASGSPARAAGWSPKSPTSPTTHNVIDFSSASMATSARRRSSVSAPQPPPSHHRRGSSVAGKGVAMGAGDWQDRFEIEALEVWGCGGDEEAERQRRRIEGEEREARMRREGVVGRHAGGDVEAEREILRMAGLIGAHREGGSIA